MKAKREGEKEIIVYNTRKTEIKRNNNNNKIYLLHYLIKDSYILELVTPHPYLTFFNTERERERREKIKYN